MQDRRESGRERKTKNKKQRSIEWLVVAYTNPIFVDTDVFDVRSVIMMKIMTIAVTMMIAMMMMMMMMMMMRQQEVQAR